VGPKFAKHQLIWIAIGVIVLLYIVAPQSGFTNVLRQVFHVVFLQLLNWFG
jgi:hypothetical protein